MGCGAMIQRCFRGFSLLVLLFAVGCGEAPPPPRAATTPAASARHQYSPAEVAVKLDALNRTWPGILESSMAADRELIYGTMAIIWMSGYVCDSISSVNFSLSDGRIVCNNGSFTYRLRNSSSGLPSVRLLE